MILYFSATGNSKYVAKEISKETDDELIPLRDLIKWKEYNIEVSKGENFGVVMPTYFYGLPSILLDYLKKANIILKGNNYCFFVTTYGNNYGNIGSEARKAFSKFGIEFDAMLDAKFPDNWAPGFDLTDDAKIKYEESIGIENTLGIVRNISHKRKINNLHNDISEEDFEHARDEYNRLRHARGFKVDKKKCISCGLCARQCPMKVIEMKDELPSWKEDRCTLCLGCYHRCPKHAIDYINCSDHGQYVNIKVGLDD